MDYSRGWMENLHCDGGYIRVVDHGKTGIFWSRLLDSGQDETIWHRLTMDISSLSEIGVRIALFSSDMNHVQIDGREESLEESLRNQNFGDEKRQEFSREFWVKNLFHPQDILLHDLKGRYVWFRLELMAQGGECPQVGNLKLRFPQESWTDYLPEIYQGNDFTTRFLADTSLYTMI